VFEMPAGRKMTVPQIELKRRIVREDWYWPTLKKVVDGRFKKKETKADLLLELDLRSRACCQQFGMDNIACELCFKYRCWLDEIKKLEGG